MPSGKSPTIFTTLNSYSHLCIPTYTGMEWTNWSECSVSCGVGIQTRHLKCVNLVKTDEPCPLSETEHTETRQCKVKMCKTRTKNGDRRKYGYKYKLNDYLDNTVNVDQNKFSVLKKHHIHEGKNSFLTTFMGKMRGSFLNFRSI